MAESKLPEQKLYTSDADHLAAAQAAFFIVQSYYNRRWTVEAVVRRIQIDMHAARRGGFWTADQYTYAANHYRDAIHRLYNVRITFQPAYD